MATQAIVKRLRFLDIARAFSVLASQPDKALDLAVEVADDTIRVIESNLHNVAKRLEGDPIAHEIAALLSHPYNVEAPALSPAGPVTVKGRTNGTFTWNAVQNEHTSLGNKNGAFVANWQGHTLEVRKLGPANYEGRIDGETKLHGKFKKGVRERIEKEAAKLVAA
jgi:hypothetical protein